MLVVTQTRGSALSLALVAFGFAVAGAAAQWRRKGTSVAQVSRLLSALLATLVLVSLVLWSSRGRIVEDWQSLSPALPAVIEDRNQVLGYESSSAIRLNLYRIGLELFAAQPLLGWGPGTRATEYLVPKGVIPLSDFDKANSSKASHLHSVPIEILVRFGLAGLTLGLLFLILMVQAYRRMWAQSADRELRLFLVAGGLLTLLFLLFDFRLIHLDLRFFFIAFFGVLYSYRFADLRRAVPGGEGPGA